TLALLESQWVAVKERWGDEPVEDALPQTPVSRPGLSSGPAGSGGTSPDQNQQENPEAEEDAEDSEPLSSAGAPCRASAARQQVRHLVGLGGELFGVHVVADAQRVVGHADEVAGLAPVRVLAAGELADVDRVELLGGGGNHSGNPLLERARVGRRRLQDGTDRLDLR